MGNEEEVAEREVLRWKNTQPQCVCEGVWSLGDSARSLTRRFWGLIELAERTAECSDWGLCHPLKQQLFVDPFGLHPHLHHHHHPHRRPSHGDEGPVTQTVMEVEWEDPVIQHFAVPFKADIYICFFNIQHIYKNVSNSSWFVQFGNKDL